MSNEIATVRSRVLSIQSHVVHGCVGNSAATFPMQINGVDVDTFNILSFSNHTGYALSKGYRITPEQFQSIAEGLTRNKFTDKYQYVLSGYVGNAAVMQEIGTFVESIQSARSKGSEVAYVCDPVCGDLGKLYVSEECVEVYRNKLLPLAVMALPNGFEASIISGIEINSVATAIEAANWFHTVPKVPSVVIKSFKDESRDPLGQKIFMLVSEQLANEDSYSRHLVEVECVKGYFTGTGDAFGGLLMAHFTKARATGNSLVDCVAIAATATVGVLRRTQAYRASITGETTLKEAHRGISDSDDFDDRELMIIHSVDILVGKSIEVSVTKL